MLTVSDSIKNAYNQYTTQRKSYIRVGDSSFFVQNLDVVADCYEKGNVIGNAIAKIAKFDIETDNIKDLDEFELFDGIWTGNQYEYVSLGTFKLFNEEGADDFFCSVTAYDKLVLFNKEYDPSQTTYPTTLFELLQNVCLQAGVELENISIPNGEQEIGENLFVEKESLKSVLNAICQISGNFGIISQDKVKLLLKGEKTIELSKFQLSNPEYKRTTWKINQVVLGMTDVEGEYVLRQDDDDIEKNGIHKLVINDNPFVYTQELREQYIDNLFNQVNGFGYIAFSAKWEGLPFVELGDLLTLDGKESIVLRYNLKSPKGLESTLEAPSIIDSVVKYVDNSNSINNRLSKTEYTVDKANQRIDAVVQTQQDMSDSLTPLATSNGVELKLEKSAGEPLVEFELDGRSTQDGTPTPDNPSPIESVGRRNLFNINNITENTYMIAADGELGSGSVSNLSDYIFVKANQPYYLSYSYTSLLNTSNRALCYYDTNKNFISGISIGPTSFHSFTPSQDGYIRFSYDKNYTNIQLEKGSTATNYIPYDHTEVSVKVTGKNLLNPNGASQNGSGLTFTNNGDGSFTVEGTSTANVSLVLSTQKIKLNANQLYTQSITTVSGTKTGEVVVSVKNSSDEITFNYIAGNQTITPTEDLTTHTYTYYVASGKTVNWTFKVQLEEGTVATEYEPYQSNTSTIDLQGNELCSLPNGTKDELVVENGEALLTKRIGKVVLDGSEDWKILNSSNSKKRYKLDTSTQIKQLENVNTVANMLCDRFKAVTPNDTYNNIEGITTGIADNNKEIMISITDFTEETTVDEFKTWLSTHNVEVLYELAEPETINLGEYSIDTLEGNCTIRAISNLQPSNMYCKYIRKTDNAEIFQTKENMKEYYNKYETDSRISIETDSIVEQVQSIASLVDENGQAIETVNNRVTEELTSTQAQIEVVENKVNNGVETLKNSLVTININGIQVSTNLSKVSTLITNDSFKIIPVNNPDEPLAFFGYDEKEGRSKSEMDNLTVKNYLTAGYHRQEKFKPDGEKRTGWFYVGGDI